MSSVSTYILYGDEENWELDTKLNNNKTIDFIIKRCTSRTYLRESGQGLRHGIHWKGRRV